MTTAKYLGIWMDHSHAHIIEFSKEQMQTRVLDSKFTHEEKEKSLEKSETIMHNKENHSQQEFYKLLGNTIRNYEEVILFGPTYAKAELFNMLMTDHRFSKIKIEMHAADKMTENQEHAFVRDYFEKRIAIS